MNKDLLKKIYKLRNEGFGERKIKKVLDTKYNMTVTLPFLKTVLDKIPYKKEVYTQIDRKRIFYLYSNYINTSKLVNYINNKYNYNFTICGIRCLASRYGIVKKEHNMYAQSKVTRKDECKIADLYLHGLNSGEIAKLYGYKTRNSILQKLEKLNVKRRDCNEIRIKNKSYYNFNFKEIDSVEKAYLLGLLLTDGYINIERNLVGIDLTDEDAIMFISDYINVNYTCIEPRGKAKLTKYRVIIYGSNYIGELGRLGVIKNKTFLTGGPKLSLEEEKYLPDVIRGIIDGDGWIRKDGEEFFISSASEAFISWCYESLLKLGFKDIKVKFCSNEFNGIYLIRTGRKENINILKNVIYKKPYGMMRKYNKLH